MERKLCSYAPSPLFPSKPTANILSTATTMNETNTLIESHNAAATLKKTA